jgi:uncharacterized membrane protein YeaQ/YmgE (transglycosylase-associated protein family)
MSLGGYVLLVVLGAICGAIAQFLVGWNRGGFVTAALVGFAGTLLGNWAAPKLHLPSLLPLSVEGHTIEILWAISGAVALLLVLGLFRRGSYNRWRHAR